MAVSDFLDHNAEVDFGSDRGDFPVDHGNVLIAASSKAVERESLDERIVGGWLWFGGGAGLFFLRGPDFLFKLGEHVLGAKVFFPGVAIGDYRAFGTDEHEAGDAASTVGF